MPMNFVDLRNALKHEIKPVYLINGSDIFLVQKSVDLIIEAANVANADLDISRLDNMASAEAIIAEASTVSFFGGRRIVIVRPFVNEQLNANMKKYLANPNPQCVLILVSDIAKIKDVQTVNCNPMSMDVLTKLIANQLSKSNKKITQAAATMLCEYCDNTYARIDGELNKIINFFADKQTIDTDDIGAVVTKPIEHQIYELANSICTNSFERSEQILVVLQQSGTDDYAIFGGLVSAFRRLFYSLTTTADREVVASVLGCNPFAVHYARRDNAHLVAKISNLYAYALDLEYQIKGGKISTENAIILLAMAV